MHVYIRVMVLARKNGPRGIGKNDKQRNDLSNESSVASCCLAVVAFFLVRVELKTTDPM